LNFLNTLLLNRSREEFKFKKSGKRSRKIIFTEQEPDHFAEVPVYSYAI